MKNRVFVVIVICMVLAFSSDVSYAGTPNGLTNNSPEISGGTTSASQTDLAPLLSEYLVIEYDGQTIPSRGADISEKLRLEGIQAVTLSVEEIESNTDRISRAAVIVIDGSLGSDNGTIIDQSIISLLIKYDRPIVLLGNACWLIHRLRGLSKPDSTALTENELTFSSSQSGESYLAFPHPMTNMTTLTSESLTLPVDRPQTERSRLVNLTASQSFSSLPALRYESWPLDSFLVAMQNPRHWTSVGTSFLVNVIAYAAAMSESRLSYTLAESQTNSTFSGGFSYSHSPTMDGTYYTVHMAFDLMEASKWNEWKSEHSGKLTSILDSMLYDFGAESAFSANPWSTAVNLEDSAKGLWILEVCGLQTNFSSGEITSYISARQDDDGGFENSVEVSHYVVEALAAAGSLNMINLENLGYWLEDCEITGSDAPLEPEKWGGIALNPSSSHPTNLYALHCLLSREIISNPHDDPKLVEWILSTGNDDGSFSNSLNSGDSLVKGTASAITNLQIKGQLSTNNRSNGLAWLESNQLNSGGFGVDNKSSDILAKSAETALVAMTLDWLNNEDSAIGQRINAYASLIEAPVGFELMEPVSSLMWSSWLSKASRFTHAGGIVDIDSLQSYQEAFSSWTIYPPFGNFSIAHAPEYLIDQYWSNSVWTQLFGASLSNQTGLAVSPSVESAVVQYIQQCEYDGGHYKQKSMSLDRRMQFSVAAIETLHLLNRLDAIQYRSSLESVVLSEYVDGTGTWKSSEWTLRPYMETQSAIDYLSTRAAMRLGLIDATMASEIQSTVSERIQYSDLWALSRDVATLSLLSTEFSVSFDSIDTTQLLSALSSYPSSAGWYNDSVLWQPIFTADILEMISILGLRHQICSVNGTQLSTTSPHQAQLGDSIPIDISLNSSSDLGRIYVQAFDEWSEFDNVSSDDTILIDVPSDATILGNQEIFLMLWNQGESRSYQLDTVEIVGNLNGSLEVETPFVLIGDRINGTVEWVIDGGADAGETNITIRLGDSSEYQEWHDIGISPYAISVPTDGMSSGVHNLTISLQRLHCTTLILREQVEIQLADLTYISSSGEIEGKKESELSIPASLHFSENGSFVSYQVLSIEITDESGSTVFTDSLVSQGSIQEFLWTPNDMGNYTFKVLFERNGTLERSSLSGQLHVYQDTNLTWVFPDTTYQYSTTGLSIQLTDQDGAPLANMSAIVSIYDPANLMVENKTIVTNSTGYASISVHLLENGEYSLEAQFPGLGLLSSSKAMASLLSYSDTEMHLDGIESGLVNTTWDISAKLSDSAEIGLVGEQITIRIVLLPSSIVFEQTLTTNESGIAIFQWTTDTAGGYLVNATFTGYTSRGFSSDSAEIDLRIPVTHHVSFSGGFEVSREAWISVASEDHTQTPVNGITVQFVVRDPQSNIIYTDYTVLENGFANFSWTPSVRGANTVTVLNENENWYAASDVARTVDVFEQISINALLGGIVAASHEAVLLINVIDTLENPVEGLTTQISIWLNGFLVVDSINVTDILGNTSVTIQLTDPGDLETSVTIAQQQYFLKAERNDTTTILAETVLEINLSGLPVRQGKILPISAVITDWLGNPLEDAIIWFSIENSTGYVVRSESRVSGIDGTCVMAHMCNEIGDFLIRVEYAGYSLNASSHDSQLQRVTVVPDVVVQNNPAAMVDTTFEFSVGLLDNLDNFIAGRTIMLTIMQNGSITFESQRVSSDGFVVITWIPTNRGSFTTLVTHSGDGYHYLFNDTQFELNVLEQIDGSLNLSSDTIDIYDEITLTYELSSTSQVEDVNISFEVLDMDLIPLWNIICTTNSSGVAMANYTAIHAYGYLVVRAEPVEGQYLLGGILQEQFIAKTNCILSSQLSPNPPVINELLTLTVIGKSDLATDLNDAILRIEIKRGQDRILLDYVEIVDGYANVSFIPQEKGLYTLLVDIADTGTHYSASEEFYHTVYCPTSLMLVDFTRMLEIGETLSVTVQLSNALGEKMEAQTVRFSLGSILDSADLVTDENGIVTWQTIVDSEGKFVLTVTYSTWETYLGSSVKTEIDVNFGTTLSIGNLSTEAPVAGTIPLNMSFLLADAEETPLEGRTVNISIYHDLSGLVDSFSHIQQGFSYEQLQVFFSKMGNHTIVVSFLGTEHYHPSEAAIEVFVFGTTSISLDAPVSIDHSQNETIDIALTDEIGEKLDPLEMKYTIKLAGPTSSLENRTSADLGKLSVSLFGLRCGTYSIEVRVEDSAVRLGATMSCMFNITSRAHFNITSQNLNGAIHNDHWIRFKVEDSLNDSITNAVIQVSLWSPEGKEIYGPLLTTTTVLQTDNGWAEIAWLPNRIGNYTLIVRYEGTEYITNSTLTRIVLTRHATTIVYEVPSNITYPESLEIALELQYQNGPLADTPITLLVIEGNETLYSSVKQTTLAGSVSFDVENLPSGNYSILAKYDGSSDFSPCQIRTEVGVLPSVDIIVSILNMPYVGEEGTAEVSVNIEGIDPSWEGMLFLEIMSKGGYHEILLDCSIGPNESRIVPLILTAGNYTLRCEVSNIPQQGSISYAQKLLVTTAPLRIPLDEGSLPVALSGLSLLTIGLALRRKLRITLESLPADWDS